jgi:hypothetical protein
MSFIFSFFLDKKRNKKSRKNERPTHYPTQAAAFFPANALLHVANFNLQFDGLVFMLSWSFSFGWQDSE